MLENTFCHLPSITVETERRLWDAGVQSWKDSSAITPAILSEKKSSALINHLQESVNQLGLMNPRYFENLLPSNQHWRLFREFRHAIAYVDIETTGMGYSNDHITTIALYDGMKVLHYVHGENLQRFRDDIREYKLVVTYNGKCFDVPYIERYFGIRLEMAHIDLRYVLRSLGYRGGLKGCERQLGIERGDLEDIDGYFAVLLWDEYRRTSNLKALETLLAYNIEDTVNLEKLMVTAYNMKLQSTPFDRSNHQSIAERPTVAFAPDRETIGRIRQEYFDQFSGR